MAVHSLRTASAAISPFTPIHNTVVQQQLDVTSSHFNNYEIPLFLCAKGLLLPLLISPSPCQVYSQNLSNIARLKVIVGLHLLPGNEFLLSVGGGSCDDKSKDMSVLYLRPSCHVQAGSLIQTVRVIFGRKQRFFQPGRRYLELRNHRTP